MILDLRKGICETDQYNAWKFPGGEIHFKINYKILNHTITIITNMDSSDSIMLLILMVQTIKKDYPKVMISLDIRYMAYQQADRNFEKGECFSLKTISNLINLLEINKILVFDPHSDVTPALLNNVFVRDNSGVVTDALYNIDNCWRENNFKNIIILAPDAGAYKKIFSLCEKIGFKGQIETCSKSRNHETGKKTIIVPKFDETKDVLIIDDICLAGGTFLGIANQIKNKCYLAVSHGVFNNGIDHLLERFEMIFTTDSREDKSWMNDRLKIYKL